MGQTGNDARSFTPWYLVTREAETEQFFPTCRMQMNTVVSRFIVLQSRHFDEDKGSECDGDTRGVKSLFNETLPGKMCRRRIGQRSLACLTPPIALAKPCAVLQNTQYFRINKRSC